MLSKTHLKKSIINVKLELNITQSQITTVRCKTNNKLQCSHLAKMILKNKDTERQHNDICPELFQLIITNSYLTTNPHIFQPFPYSINTFRTESHLLKPTKKQIQSSQEQSLIISQDCLKSPQQSDNKQQDNLTAQSPTNLTIKGQSIKHQQSTKFPSNKKPINQEQNKLQNIKTLQKLDTQQQPPNPKKHRTYSTQRQNTKFSKKKIIYNNITSLTNSNHHHPHNNNNPYIFNKYQNSKKLLLLPQIKQTIQKIKHFPNHPYHLSQKSNIPHFFHDSHHLKNIKSQSYVIMQYPSAQLLLTNKSMNQYQIASLTKIMTFYIIQKITKKFHLSIRQQYIQITDSITDITGGTSAEIKVGQIYTIEQLLYGLMLPSGNDAATALAEWGGNFLFRQQQKCGNIHKYQSISKAKKQYQTLQIQHSLNDKIKLFINEMNLTAKQLGLKSTKYANQHGLCHSQSKSTALDTARLCLQCLKDQFFQQVISTQLYKCTPKQLPKSKPKRQVIWKNTNKLLRRPQFIGIKTGITVTAGPCLASAYKFRDKIYICVILRARKVSRRFKQTRKLLAWTLEKLYKNSLSDQQIQKLNKLKKNNVELDSDHSQEEDSFNYESTGNAEFQKRRNIINYQI